MDQELGCWSGASVWRGNPLLTARLKLRPFSAADAPALVALLEDGVVGRLTAHIPYPYGLEQAHAFIQAQELRRQTRSGVALALERSTDGRLVGAVGFGLEEKEDPELGYWLGQEFWRQGLMEEAVRRLTRHLLGELGHGRIWAKVHPDNQASFALLTKLGFLPSGDVACHQTCRGESVTARRLDLSRSGWLAVHQARPMLLVAAAALIDADNRVLMASRPPGKMMAGLWEFPGGKVGPQETPEAALVRELAEELGIDVGQSCLAPLAFASHDYDTFHLLMPLYAVRQWKGTVTAREGQSLKWVRAGALFALPMPPADIPLVALLRDWL